MDSVAAEPSCRAKSTSFSDVIGGNYDIILKESIDRLLIEFQRGISDFSGFVSIFSRILHAKIDPPLETIWLYLAVINDNEQCSSSRVSRARDLFQSLATCAALCNDMKRVAVMAPVLVVLHRAVDELFKLQVVSKEVKKMEKIDSLLEGILSYASMHSCKGSTNECDSVALLPCFPDLVRIWMIGPLNRDCEVSQNSRAFFPLLSDEICKGFGDGDYEVGHLAGAVIVEAFLLRLCLKIKAGVSKPDLQRELRTWSVGSISGFQNCYFFEILLQMLLEPALPVTSILNSEDEVFLRKIIYDSMILVDYSILTPDKELFELSSCTMKYLALTRLIVVHEAIQFVRRNGDHKKASSYLNAFSKSHSPPVLVRWISNHIGIGGKASIPNVTTPESLLKWLLKLEDQGVEIFGGRISKFRAKLVNDLSNVDYEPHVIRSKSKEVEENLFYIDNQGDVTSVDAAFLSVAHTMNHIPNNGKSKRKEAQKNVKGQRRIKYRKCHFNKDDQEKQAFIEDGNGDVSKGENSVSDDEDTEMMEE